MPHQAHRSETDLAGSIQPDAPVGFHPQVNTHLTSLESPYLLIEYGDNDGQDFIIHLEPVHPQRKFPEDLSDVCRLVKKHLVGCFPRNTVVEIDLPHPDWEVQHIVFLAKGAVQEWAFLPENVERALPGLVKDLEEFLDAYAAFRRQDGRRRY